MTIEDITYAQSGKELSSEWQRQVLGLVLASGTHGVTDGEVQDATGKGHGSTSSALSTLHKGGYIFRLKEKRNKFTVYVAPKYRLDRDILPPMTNKGLLPVDHSVCEATESILVSQNDDLRRENKELARKAAHMEAVLQSRGIDYA